MKVARQEGTTQGQVRGRQLRTSECATSRETVRGAAVCLASEGSAFAAGLYVGRAHSIGLRMVPSGRALRRHRRYGMGQDLETVNMLLYS
ncbi:hypothetical protein CY34DRAFT_238155 [Suillus luteus UH-Slu-Lm8-n1]|uniref:Unplaced genomic scaffold CY34scaffold_153, whole genome shotgun sequence n=1 Tax=Suillus luteus UH-Slu-Lm8-n1 TaxID=930992 RepID=A0A0D0BBW1_9AGAM|nr:hypothetical protein CY34DRAFT_238155 [Suillus luteus UH-Slu-Lm8-n1]